MWIILLSDLAIFIFIMAASVAVWERQSDGTERLSWRDAIQAVPTAAISSMLCSMLILPALSALEHMLAFGTLVCVILAVVCMTQLAKEISQPPGHGEAIWRAAMSTAEAWNDEARKEGADMRLSWQDLYCLVQSAMNGRAPGTVVWVSGCGNVALSETAITNIRARYDAALAAWRDEISSLDRIAAESRWW